MASYSVKLRSGNLMPMIGLGTSKSTEDAIIKSVLKSLELGYRHIDTALNYGNEKAIGQALKIAFEKGIVKRNELFITTKLPWNGYHPSRVRSFLKLSMEDLGITYVDLYLIHWPVPLKYLSDRNVFPKENGRMLTDDVDHLDTWKAMESLVHEGLVKNIGLSNFNSQQIKYIYDNSTIKPANLQVECHIYLQQEKLFNYCRTLGISVTAYAPLGSPSYFQYIKELNPSAVIPELPSLLEDPVLNEIAGKRGKTTAQIALRFLVQRGILVIPKSEKEFRLKENYEIFNFDLTEEEMLEIKQLDRNLRYFEMTHLVGMSDHPKYPFNIEF